MLFDQDEDGTITMAELGVVMRSLGQRPTGRYRANAPGLVQELFRNGPGFSLYSSLNQNVFQKPSSETW